MAKVVTRYAPSPTGNPHIGNIRTALFAYLHAKSQNGQFLLRIEDTDRNRFVPGSLKYIEDSLKWLNIEYDGEKVFQSDRLPTYQEYADELVRSGYAYKCFCTSERLEKLRKEQEANKQAPGYDRCCLQLSTKEVAAKEEGGEPFVIRFKMPDTGKASWNDLVRGKIEIDHKTQDDPIILKSDGWPTYHLANIIDDHEMGITDVVRGEEWIPSTPKHLAMYKAFGWEPPKFAHLPVILGSDKSKLSKRHGDTAILDYREKGYLPEAMINFLALLGWNPGTEQEIFSLKELEKIFDLKRVGKAPAVFDIEKLNWLNGQYIRKIDAGVLTKTINELYPNLAISKLPNFDRIIDIEKTRLVALKDITEGNEYFYIGPKGYNDFLIFKKSSLAATKTGLNAALTYFKVCKWGETTVEGFEKALLEIVEKNSLTNGDVFWPVRVALSGKEKSPSPAELLWALGKDESLNRIKKALEQL